jgi:hypothetical protein
MMVPGIVEAFDQIFCMRYHVLEFGVDPPVSTGILSKRELLDAFFGQVFVELEQNGKTRLGDEEMGRFERDVVPRHTAY